MQQYLDLVIEIFRENILGQVVWLIAFIFSIYTFLFCENKKFIVFMAIISFMWGLHFWLIWLLAASLIHFIDLFKNILALKYEKSKKLAFIFIIFYIIVWFISYESYISLIPSVTAVFSTYLVFYVRWIWLNIWFMFIISLWALYNFLGNSIWWLATDITLLITWTAWIIRIILSKKAKKDKPL